MKISFIICSRDASAATCLLQNIRDTVEGTPIKDISGIYETIIIDNALKKYSIFEAYNLAISQSTGDILCFMHEDITYLSKDWGQKLRALFASDPSIGACAVAGCSIVRRCPSMYSISKYNSCNIEQGRIDLYDPKIQDLANFDGMWFCIRRECFQKIFFDDKTFKGFHFYDADIAMQLITAGYRIAFLPDVPIRHLGSQQLDIKWLCDSYRFYDKWKKKLPVYTTENPPSKNEMRYFEKKAAKSSLRLIIKYRQWGLIMQWWKMIGDVLGCSSIQAALEVILTK